MRIVSYAMPLLLTACEAAPAPKPPAPATVDTRVVGYLAGWERDYLVRDIETSGAASRLTHLVYAFGKVTGGACQAGGGRAEHREPIAAAESVDGVADRPGAGPHGTFGQLRKLKARHPGLKVLWSFGGWTGSRGFTEAARDPAAFAESCRRLLADERWAGVFDGIDLDWEYPNACGLSCDNSGPDALPRLLTALRAALGPGALVTAAVPGDLGKLAATDYAAAAGSANWLGVMTYDYFGTGKNAGPTAAHSPLTAYPGIPRPAATADAAIRGLLGRGIPPGKLLLGVGFYGRGWAGVTAAAPGGTATGPAPGPEQPGLADYAVLHETCPPTGTAGGTAYAHCRGQWWSYDTAETIRTKMAYARGLGLGGAFAWELSGDTRDAQLVGAMAAGLAR